MTRTIDTTSETDALPARFDDRVALEISDDEGHPQVLITDTTQDEAWIRASVSQLESLSELR